MPVATMTKKKEEDTPLFDKIEHNNELEQIKGALEAGQLLEETCYAVDLEVNWFSGSAAAKGAVADEMIDVAESEKDAVSISTRLFSCKHPLVERCESAKRALYAFRDSRTFPLAKIQSFLTTEKDKGVLVSTKGGTGRRREVSKDCGIRVIAREKLDSFIEQIRDIFGPAVIAAVEDLNAHMDEVLEFEQNRQKRLFRKENYPKEIHASIRVMPRRLGLGIEFEKHCPTAAKLLKDTAQKQLSDTVELAVADFVDNFLGVIKTVTNQLGYRTRIRPGEQHPKYGYLHDAEVVSMLTSKDDPEIQEGAVLVEFRYTPAGTKKSQLVELPFTDEEFQKLRPYTTEERKKVVETSLEGFMWQLERYKEIASSLGAPGKQLGEIVAKARDVFNSAGSNKDQMLKEMRESSFFRKQAVKELAHVKDALQDMMVCLPAFKGRRRAIGKMAKED